MYNASHQQLRLFWYTVCRTIVLSPRSPSTFKNRVFCAESLARPGKKLYVYSRYALCMGTVQSLCQYVSWIHKYRVVFHFDSHYLPDQSSWNAELGQLRTIETSRLVASRVRLTFIVVLLLTAVQR